MNKCFIGPIISWPGSPTRELVIGKTQRDKELDFVAKRFLFDVNESLHLVTSVWEMIAIISEDQGRLMRGRSRRKRMFA
jgi:hypothetical protein